MTIHSGKWRVFWLACWAGLIFGTSCTVITTDQLFALVGAVAGEGAAERFQIFWGIVWFSVVKGWHVTEFLILTLLLQLTLHHFRPRARARNLLIAAGCALVYAMTDEYHQSFIPDRMGRSGTS
ncbi:VanZ family protein [Planctomicrobium sp. SH664]|uniref:VanZ family protein n=1 Tax=Planctomicrobium sp. SH664 TaxID=3448125 RepID=UPI003F5C3AFF